MANGYLLGLLGVKNIEWEATVTSVKSECTLAPVIVTSCSLTWFSWVWPCRHMTALPSENFLSISGMWNKLFSRVSLKSPIMSEHVIWSEGVERQIHSVITWAPTTRNPCNWHCPCLPKWMKSSDCLGVIWLEKCRTKPHYFFCPLDLATETFLLFLSPGSHTTDGHPSKRAVIPPRNPQCRSVTPCVQDWSSGNGVFGFLLLWQNTVTQEANWRGKGPVGLHFHTTLQHQRYSRRARTWMQELIQRSWRGCYLLACLTLLAHHDFV